MNIIGKRKIFFTLSGILIALGICSLIIWGLNFGIDFKGGTIIELEFANQVETENIKSATKELDFMSAAVIQKTTGKKVLIRTENLDQEQQAKLKSRLNEGVGEYEEIRLESVGPTVTKSLTNKAITAIIIASIAIIIYIAFAFRGIPKPANSWHFGTTAIITLLHDLIIVIGIFSILGYFFDFEINSLFITALLTILGYSVNDTIVIFDRIRENLNRNPNKSFAQNTNDSINQTVIRSLNTSITTLIVLLSILVLGGSSIREFIIALIVGIIVGTYSSIFIASPILVSWQSFATKKNS